MYWGIMNVVPFTILEKDSMARVVCETLVTRRIVVVPGKITPSFYVILEKYFEKQSMKFNTIEPN